MASSEQRFSVTSVGRAWAGRGPAVGLTLALWLACAPCALARQGEPVVPPVDEPPATDTRRGEPGFVIKTRRVLDRLNDSGIYPAAGTIVSGSGLAFGVTYRSPTAGRSGVSAETGTMWSIRGYREFHLQAGWLAHMRDTTRIEPEPAELWATLNARARKTTGLALFVDARHFNYRRMDYFGLDAPSSALRADFALTGTGVDLVGQWQPVTALGFSARIGWLGLRTGPGTNGQLPDIAERFSETSAPGVEQRSRYSVLGLGTAWDSRDSPAVPTRGVYAGATASRFGALNAEAPSFTRTTVDVRGFYAIADGQGVIAASLLSSADHGTDTSTIPFYLRPSLGGSRTLRSFSSARLRGESLIHTAVEFRWRAHRYVEIAPFADWGATGAGLSEPDGSRYRSAGAGIRFRNDRRVFARVDWARGREGQRVFFAVSPSF